jgi:hypothetical protein
MRRDTYAWAGPATSPATVTTASISPMARGEPIESTSARRSRPDQEPSRNSAITAAAVPRAPRIVPIRTSLSLAWPSSCATTETTSSGVASVSMVS